MFAVRSFVLVSSCLVSKARMSSSALSSRLPALPTKTYSPAAATLLQKLKVSGKAIEEELAQSEDTKEEYFRLTRSTNLANQELLQLIRAGDITSASVLVTDVQRGLEQLLSIINHDAVKREAKLSFHLERFGTAYLLLQFFGTGKLTSPSTVPLLGDEEYLCAAMNWAQEISRYALNRAIEADDASVELVRLALLELQQALLAFDFRNGPLRRKYDGLKYAVKAVEDVAFELSLLHDPPTDALFTETTADTEQGSEGDATGRFIDTEGFQSIQSRLTEFDTQREIVVKDSRDLQKASKQAIFAALRGQLRDAEVKLSAAVSVMTKLRQVLAIHPTLRRGAFSSALEEYCEARLLVDFLVKRDLSSYESLRDQVNAAEYLGGLSDLTGELGRYAVLRAAKRDLEAVKEVVEVDSLILDTLTTLQPHLGQLGKKTETVTQSLRKAEDLVFELSLLQRSGRQRKRARPEEPEETKEVRGDREDS